MEALAIRQSLEYFGYEVYVKFIGRPNDFRDFLQNKLFSESINFFILCFHGVGGGFVMPKLSNEIYAINEVRNKFDNKNVEKYCSLNNKVIFSTACTVGKKNMADVFTKNNSIFIAPKGYIEGNSAYIFVISFLYNYLINEDLNKAFAIAHGIDRETRQFMFFSV